MKRLKTLVPLTGEVSQRGEDEWSFDHTKPVCGPRRPPERVVLPEVQPKFSRLLAEAKIHAVGVWQFRNTIFEAISSHAGTQ